MKGIVFTEFLEMVEAKYSLKVVDTIVERANLPSGGSYTSVGTYPHTEMVGLLMELSREVSAPIPDLLQRFGQHLFGRFSEVFPQFFAEGHANAFAFLCRVDNYIHIEVRKLYPDAELPKFTTEVVGENRMTMLYESSRGLADLAHGLMSGCVAHFNENIAIEREDLSGGQGTKVRFSLTRSAA